MAKRRQLPRATVCAWLASFADACGDSMTREGYMLELYAIMNWDWASFPEAKA